MSNQVATVPHQTVVDPTERGVVSFIPFGSADSIKLSVRIVKEMFCTPTRSGKLPSDTEVLKFIAMCRAKRLNPAEGDAFLIGYDSEKGPSFSLITAHQAYLKRAEASPDFDGMQSGIIVRENGEVKEVEGDFYLDGQEVLGGWAKVYRKGKTIPTYRRIRLARFNKGYGEWRNDAAGMICKCAEADALRSTFPSLCGGLYMQQEIEATVIPEAATRQTKTISELRAKALPEPEPEPATVQPEDEGTPEKPEPEPEPQPARRQPRLAVVPPPQQAHESPAAQPELPSVTEPPPPSDKPLTAKQQAAENAVMAAIGEIPGSLDKDVWDWCGKKWPQLNWANVQAFNQVSDFICAEIARRAPELKKYIAAVVGARKEGAA